jgi:hypothetical protein
VPEVPGELQEASRQNHDDSSSKRPLRTPRAKPKGRRRCQANREIGQAFVPDPKRAWPGRKLRQLVPIDAGGHGPDFASSAVLRRELTLALGIRPFCCSDPIELSAMPPGDQDQGVPRRTLLHLVPIVTGVACPDFICRRCRSGTHVGVEVGGFSCSEPIERSAKLPGDQEQSFPRRTLPQLSPIVAGVSGPDFALSSVSTGNSRWRRSRGLLLQRSN